MTGRSGRAGGRWWQSHHVRSLAVVRQFSWRPVEQDWQMNVSTPSYRNMDGGRPSARMPTAAIAITTSRTTVQKAVNSRRSRRSDSLTSGKTPTQASRSRALQEVA